MSYNSYAKVFTDKCCNDNSMINTTTNKNLVITKKSITTDFVHYLL